MSALTALSLLPCTFICVLPWNFLQQKFLLKSNEASESLINPNNSVDQGHNKEVQRQYIILCMLYPAGRGRPENC
jgi:hypothetical protein